MCLRGWFVLLNSSHNNLYHPFQTGGSEKTAGMLQWGIILPQLFLVLVFLPHCEGIDAYNSSC